jgi:hypothetical protein
MRIRKKTTVTTAQRVGMIRSNFRLMYCSMVS